MKPCARFHIEDVEKGDQLVLTLDDKQTVIITDFTFSTSRFGWVVVSDIESDAAYYVDDYDYIQVMNYDE